MPLWPWFSLLRRGRFIQRMHQKLCENSLQSSPDLRSQRPPYRGQNWKLVRKWHFWGRKVHFSRVSWNHVDGLWRHVIPSVCWEWIWSPKAHSNGSKSHRIAPFFDTNNVIFLVFKFWPLWGILLIVTLDNDIGKSQLCGHESRSFWLVASPWRVYTDPKVAISHKVVGFSLLFHGALQNQVKKTDASKIQNTTCPRDPFVVIIRGGLRMTWPCPLAIPQTVWRSDIRCEKSLAPAADHIKASRSHVNLGGIWPPRVGPGASSDAQSALHFKTRRLGILARNCSEMPQT